ncbi:MAG TPA: response regulator [Chryseosolibacter sp.]
MKKTLVAIFEDDLVNRYIYEKMFRQREDITLHIFDHPEKGIQAFKETPFDVIFIEAHFRENFGGIGILKQLKPLVGSHTVFIAMTSLLQKGDLERLMGAGFMMCLEKPIVFNEIIDRI